MHSLKLQIPNAFEDLIDAKRILREIKLLSILKISKVKLISYQNFLIMKISLHL